MSFQFEIPGKTFVIGEYLALHGTASMILATKPCFVVRTTGDLSTGFHPHSPGGQLYKKLGQKVGYSFEDPHGGGGGFGRSTAEYLSVFIYDLVLRQKGFESDRVPRKTSEGKDPEFSTTKSCEKRDVRKLILKNLQDFVSTYRENCIFYQSGEGGDQRKTEGLLEESQLKTKGLPEESQHRTNGPVDETSSHGTENSTPHFASGYKPSGADLVAQVCGGLCWYDGTNFSCQNLAWPFPGYEIYIFKTGYKQKTHEHIRNLKNKNLKILTPALMSARASLEQADLKMFCESLNHYYDILGVLGLSDNRVRTGINHLRERPEVLAAKACGAMGMDTALVVARLSDGDRIEKLGKQQGFSMISCLGQSHPGVRCHFTRESS